MADKAKITVELPDHVFTVEMDVDTMSVSPILYEVKTGIDQHVVHRYVTDKHTVSLKGFITTERIDAR